MQRRHMRANLILLATALIWGFAFVAQRLGMEHLGPFTFNTIRFALGALVLLPIALLRERVVVGPRPSWRDRRIWSAGAVAGLILFGGASFQQAGLVYTTAGKAGFITGLYVVLVPLLGLLWGQRTGAAAWGGVLLAAVGLYLLTVTDNWTIALGDWLVLLSAVIWTLHVHWLARISPHVPALRFALIQFVVGAALSAVVALLLETTTAAAVAAAAVPILYAGVLSVGLAFTLQVIGQRDAHPTHAAILMSMEAVFAVAGGWLLLNETLSTRSLLGCGLMMAGMLLSQLRPQYNAAATPRPTGD